MKHPLKEAFTENYNILGLAGSAALAMVLLNPIPILAGIVVEVGYLMFIPDSSWYKARLSEKFEGEVEERRLRLREQVFPMLREEMRDRFNRLEEARESVWNQSQSPDKKWLREVVRKLDFLMEKFLHFAQKEAEFREYLWHALDDVKGDVNTGGRRLNKEDNFWVPLVVEGLKVRYDQEIKSLNMEVQVEDDEGSKRVLQRRLDILKQRQGFGGNMARMMNNLRHQLELLEDTFGLVSEQLLARPPEAIINDIDDVVSQTNSMSRVLDEMATFESQLTI